MRHLRNILFASVLLSCTATIAQQLPQFTQYMYNTISINPAYAGSRETLSAVVLYRSQWTDIDNGPTTPTVSVHSPLRNEKIGLGASLIHDELGYENFTYIYGDFSYTIHTGPNTKLAFGVMGGFTSYTLDSEFRTQNATDPNISGIEDQWAPNFGAGMLWHTNRWYLGLSAPRLLNTNYNDNSDYEAVERVGYYFTGGYVFDLSNNVKLKPAFLVKATNGAPMSYDLTANFLFYEKLWVGAGYRINESAAAIGGIVDFQISKQFRIGYAYENPISDIRPYSGGTHEFLLMFELFKEQRIKSPRYF